MTLPTYSTGTASVAAGGTIVTGVGGMWSGINVKQGDFISLNNVATVLITEVTDSTHLKIAPWPGAAQSAVSYVIYQNYVGRVVGVAAAKDVGEMLEKLHVDGLPFIVDPGLSAPDPSFGNDGQMAFQPSTGLWWNKTGGVWVSSPGLTSDASKLPLTGGTLTGPLTFNGTDNVIWGKQGGNNRWLLRPGNDTFESGGNIGSDFDLHRYADDGAYLGQALRVSRQTGIWSIAGTVSVGDKLYVGPAAPTSAGDIGVARVSAPTTGVVYFGNTSGKYLFYNGTGFELTAPTTVQGNILANGGMLASNVPSLSMNLRLTETTGGWSKYMRTINGGTLEWINNANTTVIMSLSDVGYLNVTGNVNVGNILHVGGSMLAAYGAPYNILYNGAGAAAIYLGSAGDPSNYYRNAQHYCQTPGGAYSFWATEGYADTNICTNFGTLPQATPWNCAMRIAYYGGITQYGLAFRPSGDNTTPIIFSNSAAANCGSISQTTTTVAFNTSSDLRLKDDLKFFDAGDIIDKIEVHDFQWKISSERAHGVVAQQVKDIYPEAVHHEETQDWWGVDYSKFVPLLLQEIKALRERVKTLELLKE